nr:PREDICTED: uncharacterized protein LOC105663686 [Megachile rotundata]
MRDHFWRRWAAEYLNTLQTRSKWSQPQPNVKPGDLCLITSEVTPPTKWPVGRIIEVYPGSDGKIRAIVTMEMTLHRVLRNVTFLTVTMSSLIKYHIHWYQANRVSYNIKHYYFQTAVSAEVTDTTTPRKHINNKNMSYLIKSVIMHREAILFCNEYDNYIKLSYTPLIILAIISLSINLFLSQSMLHSANIGDLLLFLMLVVGEVQYMFLTNFAVQFAIDGATNISIYIYNTSWYETSIATQKLLQMVILKSNQGYSFTFYNMFYASLRGFSVLFQTSISYFTVLISLK